MEIAGWFVGLVGQASVDILEAVGSEEDVVESCGVHLLEGAVARGDDHFYG